MIRVLFVDDDPALLEITKLFLERMGDMAVQTARSGTEALLQLTKSPYDVIVSDYDMPEMDGIALLRALRGSGDLTPFIIFTGKHRAHVVIDALNNNADFYLQKGGDPRTQFIELTDMIHKSVQRRKAEIALEVNERPGVSGEVMQVDLVSRFLPDGRYIFVNEAFCRYFDLPCPEIIGKIYHPTIPVTEREMVARHFSSLTPSDPVRLIAHHIILHDGTERLIQWSDRAIFSPEGVLVEYQSVGRDVTDLPRVVDYYPERDGAVPFQSQPLDARVGEGQAGTTTVPLVPAPPAEVYPAASASVTLPGPAPVAEAACPTPAISHEQAIASTIENLPDPTFAIDRNGVVIAWNRPMEELTGVDAVVMVGKGNYEYGIPLYGERRPVLIDLILQPKNEPLRSRYHNLRNEGDVLIGQTGAARVTGEIRSLWGKAVPIYGRAGEVIGAIETIRDITAVRASTEEAEVRNPADIPEMVESEPNKGLFGKIFRKSPEGWYKEGVDLFYRQGKFAEGIAAFDKAIEGDESMVKAWMAKGMCQKELGKYSDAMNSFDRVLVFNRADEGALYHKGETLEKLGKTTGEMAFYEKAIQCFDAVLKLNAENVHGWNYRGICFKELGILDEARRSFETAQQLIRKGKEIKNMQHFGLKVK